MSVRAAFAALALLALPAAAFASPGASAAQPDGSNSGRQICKTTERIGSRLGGTRTCKTAAEWAELKAQARLVTERVQDMGNPQCRAAGLGGGCSSDGP